VAISISEQLADRTAGIINLHPNITHNALYREEFNIWFALWSPPGDHPERDVVALLDRAEVKKHRVMHDLATFINGDQLSEPEAIEIDPSRRELIELLQRDLELIARPFRHLARSLNIGERQLIDELIKMHEERLIERYGGIPRRQQPGFEEVRALLALRVDKRHQHEAAREFSTHPAIRRAYVREMSDDLPYNVYTNLVAPDMQAFDRLIAKVVSSTYVLDHKSFISMREYKNCRLRYFTSDYELWKESFLEERVEQ
jgi:DNA-binding Lrp family transcriptional regulator